MPEAIVKTPLRRLEIYIDESTNPPTINAQLAYPDDARNLWVLKQLYRRILQGPGAVPVKK